MYSHKKEYKTVKALFKQVFPSLSKRGNFNYRFELADEIKRKLATLKGNKFLPVKTTPKQVDCTITILVDSIYNSKESAARDGIYNYDYLYSVGIE